MQPKNYTAQLDYYKKNFDEVHVVSCDNCKSPLAFEVKGGASMAGNPNHPEGRLVVPVDYPNHPQGMALLSWRPRLDGEVGYLCGAIIDNPEYDKEVKAIDELYSQAEAALATNNKNMAAEFESAKKAHAARVKQFDKEVARIKNEGQEVAIEPPTLPTAPEPMTLGDKPTPTAPKQKMCLTDTRVAESERYMVPVSNSTAVPVMSPFEKAEARASIAASGKKPDVEITGRVKRIEKFKVERVK